MDSLIVQAFKQYLSADFGVRFSSKTKNGVEWNPHFLTCGMASALHPQTMQLGWMAEESEASSLIN